MANDIDLSPWNNYPATQTGGGLAPSPASGGNLPAVDHIGNNYVNGRQVGPANQQRQVQGTPAKSWFGENIAGSGATVEQLEQQIDQLGAVFTMDAMKLGHPKRHVDSMLAWVYANFDAPAPTSVPVNHRYPVPAGYENDLLARDFMNHCQRAGCSKELVQTALWWIQTAAQKLSSGGAAAGQGNAQPNFGSPDLADYTDADAERIIKANERAAATTEITLKQRFGDRYLSVINTANAYLASLPAKEQQRLSSLTQGGVSGLNTVEVITGLYNSAIGAGSLPKNSAGVAQEIASIENLMRTNRKAYMRDEQMQARYRELLEMKGRY